MDRPFDGEIVIVAAQMAAVFGSILLAACAAALLVAWLVHRPIRPAIRRHAMAGGAALAGWLIFAVAVLSIPTPVDDCLDAGGRWDERLGACAFELGPVFGLRRQTPSAGAAPAPA